MVWSGLVRWICWKFAGIEFGNCEFHTESLPQCAALQPHY